MKRLSPYSIGAPPTFDPCEKCIVKVNCSEQCDDRLRYFMAKVKATPPSHRISLKRRRKKK